MGQLGFTDSIFHENLVPGVNFKQETEEKIKTAFNKPVIIYGASIMGQHILNLFQKIGIPVLAVCDNYKNGQKMQTGEVITTFKNVFDKYDDYIILIASYSYYYEIKNDILKYVNKEKIVSFPSDVRYLFKMKEFISGPCTFEEYKKFVNEQKGHIDHVSNLLSDNKSLKVLRGLICGRLTNNLQYINNISESNQYFPSDIIGFSHEEIFIDGGAYTGDTLHEFIKRSGKCFSKAYCYEPGKWQANRFQNNYVDLIASGKVVLIQKGLWDKSEILSFIDNNNVNSRISSGQEDNKIQTVSIDETVPKKEKVTFIKMDIEGSELKALKGAEKTILRNKPKLAICIYHKPEDIFEIPEYIDSLGLGYKLYIRHHGIPPLAQFGDTVLYAL